MATQVSLYNFLDILVYIFTKYFLYFAQNISLQNEIIH